jgi:hypothetical protein
MNGGKFKGEQLFPHELVAQVWLVTQLYYMHHMRDAGANLYSFQVLADPWPSIAATTIIDAQSLAVRNGIIEEVESRKRQLAMADAPIDNAESMGDADAEFHGVAGGLSRFVPMIDLSSSMEGTPMNVAIVLGVLTSEMGKST